MKEAITIILVFQLVVLGYFVYRLIQIKREIEKLNKKD